jgi:hypothetical protein
MFMKSILIILTIAIVILFLLNERIIKCIVLKTHTRFCIIKTQIQHPPEKGKMR